MFSPCLLFFILYCSTTECTMKSNQVFEKVYLFSLNNVSHAPESLILDLRLAVVSQRKPFAKR